MVHLILEIARATDHLRAEQEKGTDSPFYNELLGREFGMAGRAHERGTTILAAARSMLEHPDHGPKVKIIEDKKLSIDFKAITFGTYCESIDLD